jgi:hypothetical protein
MRFRRRRQRSGQKSGPAHDSHQTRQSGFIRLRIEGDVEDYRARDSSSTSLVSSRPHAQPEEEDQMDEGAKDEGRSGQEGER